MYYTSQVSWLFSEEIRDWFGIIQGSRFHCQPGHRWCWIQEKQHYLKNHQNGLGLRSEVSQNIKRCILLQSGWIICGKVPGIFFFIELPVIVSLVSLLLLWLNCLNVSVVLLTLRDSWSRFYKEWNGEKIPSNCRTRKRWVHQYKMSSYKKLLQVYKAVHPV